MGSVMRLGLDHDSLLDFIKSHLTPYQVDWDDDSETGYEADKNRVEVKDMDQADVVGSLLKPGPFDDPEKRVHALLLDVDLPIHVIPSSTEGHSHLYLEVPGGIPHEGYMALIALLGHLHVIEPGYAMASIRRGHSDLRPPWVKKGEEPGRKQWDLPEEKSDGLAG